MTDIIATVQSEDPLSAIVNTTSEYYVSAVGIQGQSAGDTNIEGLTNVDATTVVEGSLLIYKTATNKWTASTRLDAQDMEGGEF